MVTRIVTIILAIFVNTNLFAAGCCGGGSSLPSLITGDYRAQVIISASNAAITHDTDSQGNITARDGSGNVVSETFTLSATALISPLWQVGLSIPYKYNSYKSVSQKEISKGISDIKLHVAYEALPEYSYNWWKPKGYLFLDYSSGMSKSTYNAQNPLRTDAFGSGFSTFSFGASLVKTLNQFDYLAMVKVYQSLSRTFTLQQKAYRMTPGIGHSFLIGIGYSPFNSDLRLGGDLLYNYEAPNVGSTTAMPIFYWQTGLTLSYLLGNTSISVAYQDQSFLASASNTPLTKSLSLSLINFFEL